MVLDSLTPDEIALHTRAIEKIRRKLFARHSREEYGIVPGSEEVLAATAEKRWCAGVGTYRRITWGGLRFWIVTKAESYELTISHFERDIFSVHIADERGHTEVESRARLPMLDSTTWKHVTALRRAADRAQVR